jgi:putative copper export protein
MKQEMFFLVSGILLLVVATFALKEFGWETGQRESREEKELSTTEIVQLNWRIFSGVVVFIILSLVIIKLLR